MRKILTLIFTLALLASSLFACKSTGGDGRIKIVATIFPAYDFARNIAGERADVSLLLPPGVEPHSYEPTPKDMVSIQNCDLFIFNGGESESWIENVLTSIDGGFKTLKMTDCVDTLLEEDGNENEHGHGDEPEYDEHIWTSPVICKDICAAISEALCEKDPENAADYKQNAAAYIEKLNTLDREIKDTVKSAKRRVLIFGDRFPFKYFSSEYGLDCYAAFPGCSTQTEPSAAKMAELIDKARNEHVPAVFYIEMSNMRVADTLAESTGARKLLLHSCHNLSRDELERGEDYISLMKKNLENLKIALN